MVIAENYDLYYPFCQHSPDNESSSCKFIYLILLIDIVLLLADNKLQSPVTKENNDLTHVLSKSRSY